MVVLVGDVWKGRAVVIVVAREGLAEQGMRVIVFMVEERARVRDFLTLSEAQLCPAVMTNCLFRAF